MKNSKCKWTLIPKALALSPRDPVILKIEDATLRLIPLREVIAEAQQRVRQYILADAGLVESVLQERRREGQREGGNSGSDNLAILQRK